jgi:hypothetical protein
MRAVTTRSPARPASRPDPRDVLELKALKARSPELATAVDLQLASFDLFKRAQARVPLPPLLDTPRAQSAIASGQALLRFADVPVNWNDFRWVLRETTDLLARFELIDGPTQTAIHALMREAHTMEPQVEAWFTAAVARKPAESEFGEVFARAMRPFVARCAEVWAPRVDLSDWRHGWCPLCAGDPELGIIAADGDRRLVCGRCTTRWPHPPERCPFCDEDRAAQHTTLSTRDGKYTLDACDTCRRYVKCCDERYLGRPALPWVDAVATMPLDAAAMQKGYEG